MRNVMIVDGGVSFGGSVVVAARLANNLARFGYKPVVVSSIKTQLITHHFSEQVKLVYLKRYISYADRGKLDGVVERRGEVLKKISMYLFSLAEWLSNAVYAVHLLRIIKKENVKIIHANNNMEPIWLSILLRIPCVWHFHGFADPGDKLKRFFIRRCKKHISISNSVTRSINDSLYLDQDTLITLYNPLGDSEGYTHADLLRLKADLRIGEQQKVIGVFGRLVPWKGQKQFLEAFKIVVANCPDTVALIVGDDSEYGGFHSKLKALAERLEIDKNVVFCGYVHETSKYYQICDVVVHSSISPEPFGLVITEAMHNRVPVIASSLGAGVELIKPYETGILVNPYEAEAMSDAICNVLQDEELRKSLVANGYKYVIEMMDPILYASNISKYCYDPLN